MVDEHVEAEPRAGKDPRALSDDALLDELRGQDIERAIGDAVEGEEHGWCNYLDAELSEDRDDADWAADELLERRLRRLRKAGAFLVALVEGQFQLDASDRDLHGLLTSPGRAGAGWRGRCQGARLRRVGDPRPRAVSLMSLLTVPDLGPDDRRCR